MLLVASTQMKGRDSHCFAVILSLCASCTWRPALIDNLQTEHSHHKHKQQQSLPYGAAGGVTGIREVMVYVALGGVIRPTRRGSDPGARPPVRPRHCAAVDAAPALSPDGNKINFQRCCGRGPLGVSKEQAARHASPPPPSTPPSPPPSPPSPPPLSPQAHGRGNQGGDSLLHLL